MFSTRLAAIVAALVALAIVPAVASAQSVPMRGVVSGSPYGASNGQMAVPVLSSKMTARNAGLKSPVGVIVMKRTQKVKLPGGAPATLPVNLRTGGRFKGVGDVGALQQRVFYPRVVFSKPQVYFRSKELSLAELSAAIDSLRNALADLQNQLTNFKNQSIAAFNALLAEINALKKQLADLKIPAAVDLTNIQSQIDALNQKLNDLIAGLPDFTQFALISQLPDLTQYVKLSDLTSMLAGYATKTYVDDAIKNLQDQIDLLPTQQDVTNAINNAISNLNISQYATTTYVDGAVAAVNDRVDGMCDVLYTSGVLKTAIDTTAAANSTFKGQWNTTCSNHTIP